MHAHVQTGIVMACMLAEVCLILPLHALLVTVSGYLILCLLCSSHEQWGQTAVLCASAAGHPEVVKLLVQAKADVELQHKVQ